MRARVPAMARQIDAAAERQLIVDHDHLLVMAGADGMTVVKPEPHASRHSPSEPPSRERIALERVERSVVPRQDVATKVRATSCDIREQLVEPRRRVRRLGGDAREQIDVGHDVPAQNEDRCGAPRAEPAGPDGSSRRHPECSKSGMRARRASSFSRARQSLSAGEDLPLSCSRSKPRRSFGRPHSTEVRG